MYNYEFKLNNKLLNPIFYEELLSNPIVNENPNLTLSGKYLNGTGKLEEINLEGKIQYKSDAFNLTRDLDNTIERTIGKSFFYLNSNNIFNPKLLPRETFFIYNYRKTKSFKEFNHMKLVMNRIYRESSFKTIKKKDRVLISGFEENLEMSNDSLFFGKLSDQYNSLKLIYLNMDLVPKKLIDMGLKDINIFARN